MHHKDRQQARVRDGEQAKAPAEAREQAGVPIVVAAKVAEKAAAGDMNMLKAAADYTKKSLDAINKRIAE
ncbi:MAG: hypothetical protein WBM69_03350, partial [Desulfobacterales bacterium]